MIGLILGSVFGLMFLGVPVAFAIISGLVFIFSYTGILPLIIVPQRLITGMDSFPLLAVPLFIVVGNLMDKGGISKRLIDWAESLIGYMVGSLGMVAIISCAMFAALTGSGPATVATIGCIVIPAMVERGYSKSRAAGLVASAGALGPIIPPSIPMIVYGCAMNISIPDMFIGGVIPGLMITALLIAVNYIVARRTPSIMAAPVSPFSFNRLLRTSGSALGALLLPLIVLGGIYSGVFTPTEAASMALIYSLFIGLFVYKELKLSELPALIVTSMQVSAMTVFITGTANIFSYLLARTHATNLIAEMMFKIIKTPASYLIALLLFLFIVGCLMDTIASILIIAPIISPIGIELGVDALHLAVLFVIALVVGFVTPPFGYNLFTAVAITGVKFDDVVKGSLPYLFVLIVAIFIIAFCPRLVTWLPATLSAR
jgi:C4-dicarboxylate transporter DctM subunit